MKKKKIIYYKNELEEEFSTAQITAKKIDEHYKYEGGPLFSLGKLFFYEIIAKPLAFCFMKIKFGHKIIGKKRLKEAKKEGYFLYGNHTISCSAIGNNGITTTETKTIDVINRVFVTLPLSSLSFAKTIASTVKTGIKINSQWL